MVAGGAKLHLAGGSWSLRATRATANLNSKSRPSSFAHVAKSWLPKPANYYLARNLESFLLRANYLQLTTSSLAAPMELGDGDGGTRVSPLD